MQTEYQAVEKINHCVVEPDERAVMDEEDAVLYARLMDAMLTRADETVLSQDDEKNAFLLDLLKESPYGFFAEVELSGSKAVFTYTFEKAEQDKMLAFMDGEFLSIVNFDARKDDNTLDIVMKIYYAVTQYLDYDKERRDNKEFGSPLFHYPSDEVYKAMKEKKSLCYGFAYILNFALLQRGIDCFKVYGKCHDLSEGHMWNVFEIDGEYFNCDAAWDRSKEGKSKLYHFGKTDQERKNDTVYATDFSLYHEAAYGDVSCTDNRFSLFRGIIGFSYIDGHRFSFEDSKGKESVFDTETFLAQ